mmetsp:Transcript_21500/g.46875  ORF Transcript_21500/g.46875 Transcript_21500/m.46875 type:complete len:234 (+) Transcript_21500:225-926(+)
MAFLLVKETAISHSINCKCALLTPSLSSLSLLLFSFSILVVKAFCRELFFFPCPLPLSSSCGRFHGLFRHNLSRLRTSLLLFLSHLLLHLKSLIFGFASASLLSSHAMLARTNLFCYHPLLLSCNLPGRLLLFSGSKPLPLWTRLDFIAMLNDVPCSHGFHFGDAVHPSYSLGSQNVFDMWLEGGDLGNEVRHNCWRNGSGSDNSGAACSTSPLCQRLSLLSLLLCVLYNLLH